MSKIILIKINKLSIIYKFLIWTLFLFLPIMHSRVFSMFWIDLNMYVNGNYEFTKVILFNIISTLIFISFLIHIIKKKKTIHIHYSIFLVIFILFISTIFSISPLTSLLWWTSKWHGFFMFLNLIWLFIVLAHGSHHFLKRCWKIVLLSSFLVAFLGIWQYAFPSFDYGALWNRAISTLGHPNYVSLYLLIILPLLYKKLAHRFSHLYLWFTLLIIVCLILTKSLWWIWLFIGYNLYYFHKTWKQTSLVIVWSALVMWMIFVSWEISAAKLHSFLSRFALWETTLRIIFSDWKTLLIWSGLETLSLSFDTHKSQYLYIYENFWYTADRSHNLLLNIWYHTGILWLSAISYITYYGYTHIKKTPYKESFVLFLLFTVFNFPSIVHYSVLALIIAIATQMKSTQYKTASRVVGLSSFIAIVLISIVWWYFSYQFYQAEIEYRKWNTQKAAEIFPYHAKYFYSLWEYESWWSIEWYKSKNYFKSKIKSLESVTETCQEFTKKFPTAENHFYCWEQLEILWYDDDAMKHYKSWLENLPDLWNDESEYYKNIFIKNTINGNRFFSEKYSPVKEVLEKVDYPIIFSESGESIGK